MAYHTDAGSMVQIKLRSLPYFVRELAAGGVAGGLAKTVCAPLERTKILFQTGRSKASIQETLAHMWQTEGVKGLFKGNTASVMRIVPYAAVHFGLYEQYRRWLVENLAAGSSGAGQRVHPAWDLLAGSLSGATAVVLTYPLDLVRTRLAWVTEAGSTSTSCSTSSGSSSSRLGIRSVLSQTLNQEGLAGLYRGIAPTLLGILPYAGIKFFVYQSLKSSWRQGQQQQQQQQPPPPKLLGEGQQVQQPGTAGGAAAATAASTALPVLDPAATSQAAATEAAPAASTRQQRERLPVPVMLLFGGVSGLIAQTITYPLDLVRRRMQVHSLQHIQPVRPTARAGHPLQRHHHRHQQHQPAGQPPPAAQSAPAQAQAKAGRGPLELGLHQVATGGSSSSSSRSLPPPSTWHTFKEIHSRGGLRALYKGLSINYFKVVPSTAIGFTIYDALKAYLDLQGNI